MADDRYGTPAGFRVYHIARGRSVSAWQDDEINASLLVGSEFIDSRFGSAFPGIRVGQRAQIRAWPRSGVVDRNGYAVPNTSVPSEVENATYEAAYVDLEKPGALVTTYTPNKYKSVKIEGSISVDFAQPLDASEVQNHYPAIGAALANVLCKRGSAGAFSAPVSRV